MRGQRVGRYELAQKIGAGGMGEVWKAWDTDLARWVALKLLKGVDPDEVARFKREAQTAARLSHPNIAAVYEVGEWDGRPFIAMQYIAGSTLPSGGDPRALAALVRDAARAVHHAHELRIVHRDLKPANIMVEGTRAFVMDFGLARRIDARSSISASGVILGTPAYMSPEQSRGEAVDARTDVYGLGAALYEALAGRPPFAGANVVEVLRKVQEEEPAPLAGVDPDLATIAAKCLEKDRERRYASASELADDLDRWLAGEPVAAHPPSLAYRLRKRVGRHRAVAAAVAAGVAAVALTAALVVPAWRASRARADEERRAREDAERRQAAMQELGRLWTEAVTMREWVRQDFRRPEEIRAGLDAVIAGLTRYMESHPKEPQGWYARARARIWRGDEAGARKDIERAIEIAPEFGPAWAVRAQLLVAAWVDDFLGGQGDPEQRSEQAAPQLERAREALSKLRGGAGAQRWGLARTAEDDVIETVTAALVDYFIDKRPESAVRRLAEASVKAPSEEYCRWLAVLEQRPRQKRQFLDDGLSIAPHYATLHLERGMMRQGGGDLAGAIQDYTGAIALQESARAYLWRGRARRKTKESAEAVRDLTRAIELAPEEATAYGSRGLARMDARDWDGAIDDFTRAISIEPRPQDYVNRGSARRAKRDLAGCVEDCTRALELASGGAAALRCRGLARHALGDGARALADLDAAVQADPRGAETLHARACVRRETGDRAGAAEDYGRMIALNDGDSRAWIERGLVLGELGDWRGAERDFTRALDFEDTRVDALTNRGLVRTRLGDSDGAVEDWTRALELNPRLAQTWANRAAIHLSRGDRKAARADYRKALEAAPADWPNRAKVEERIRQLED